MHSPIALGRPSLSSVALATVCAIAAALVLVALGEGGVPDRLASPAAPATNAPPPPAPVFEANAGQLDREVEFSARGRGYTLFLTGDEAVLSLQSNATELIGGGTLTRGTGMEPEGAVVRMGLAGANAEPALTPHRRTPATTNYISGDDPSKWRTGIPTFGRVQYRSVYPGIDMAWYGNSAGLEYDFELAPGADPSRIGLTFEGAENVALDGRDLVISTAVGDLRHQAPYAYQETGGVRERVAAEYTVRDGVVGVELGAYDRTRPLVIDPQLLYSTYVGGSASDQAAEIAVDGSGSAYIVGTTQSTDYPTTSGAQQGSIAGSSDAFVSKLSPDGSSLVYSTYLGGPSQDHGTGIAVDGDGHAYVTGRAGTTWPTTPGSFQQNDPSGSPDLFVVKLSTDGTDAEYSTYLGAAGIFEDYGSIAVDADGSAYVTGQTDGQDWPTTPGTFQSSDPQPGAPTANFDGFVTKLKPDGSGLERSTYLGGSGSGSDAPSDITVVGETPYIAGSSSSASFPTTPGAYQTTKNAESDGFVVKLAEDFSQLQYSTFLGGNGSESAHGLDVLDGVAYVGGFTGSSNFPTTAGAFQTSNPMVGTNNSEGFVAAVAPDGGSLQYSTYLGGPGRSQEGILDLSVDGEGRATATGRTDSGTFPTTPGSIQETDPDTANEDGFVAQLSPDGSKLDYGTYLGGKQGASEFGSGIEVDGSGDVFVSGLTPASDFPTTEGSYQPDDPAPGDFEYDAFVAKIHPEREDPTPPREPATLELAPDVAVNTVGTQHCVTATVRDQDGAAFEGAVVWFEVSGASETDGGSQTDAEGHATFCYDGPAFPGSDSIEAFVDRDGDLTRDEGEPFDIASKQWVLAASTDGCKVTGGGGLVTGSGDRATFGGIVRSYVDHGPATPLSFKSTSVLAVICSEDRRSATIYGLATVNGTPDQLYRVQVTDGGEPSSSDRYELLLASGYSSGDQPLSDGNVQIR